MKYYEDIMMMQHVCSAALASILEGGRQQEHKRWQPNALTHDIHNTIYIIHNTYYNIYYNYT